MATKSNKCQVCGRPGEDTVLYESFYNDNEIICSKCGEWQAGIENEYQTYLGPCAWEEHTKNGRWIRYDTHPEHRDS